MAKGNKVLSNEFLAGLNALLKEQECRVIAASGCTGRYLVQRRHTQEAKIQGGYKSRSYYAIGICYGEALIALLTGGNMTRYQGRNEWYADRQRPYYNMTPISLDKDDAMLLKLSSY
jgi:hypothetical protein